MSPIVDPNGRPLTSGDDAGDERRVTAALQEELLVAELRGPAALVLPPEHAFQIAAVLHLTLLQIDVGDDARESAQLFIDGVCEFFTGCPTIVAILRGSDADLSTGGQP